MAKTESRGPVNRQGKAEFLRRESAAHDRWWSALAGISLDAVRSDGWTLNEVVAHIAAWQRYSTGRIRAIAESGGDPGPPDDEDGFNERARAAAGPWEETVREATEAHRALLDLVGSLPEERVFLDDGLIEFIVLVNGSEHYDEHPASDLTTV
jgi:hypothetical protein